jgi:MYXO-CTERM domain-containing protein
VTLGGRARRALLAALVAALVLAGDAFACACVAAPMDERLDDSDAAVIGRVTSDQPWELEGGVAARRLTVAVEQRVKGDLGKTAFVVVPSGTDCDVEIELEKTTGLLLTRLPDGQLYATLCSVVTPGELVAAGGEPRGGVIKVVLGILILALVLSWALRRRARGTRPSLPGAPEP